MGYFIRELNTKWDIEKNKYIVEKGTYSYMKSCDIWTNKLEDAFIWDNKKDAENACIKYNKTRKQFCRNMGWEDNPHTAHVKQEKQMV